MYISSCLKRLALRRRGSVRAARSASRAWRERARLPHADVGASRAALRRRDHDAPDGARRRRHASTLLRRHRRLEARGPAADCRRPWTARSRAATLRAMPIAAAQLDAHRGALTGHCYRMLGSPADADDAVQETMVRAFRNLDRFEGRSSLRTWLHRIATNVCLDALADRRRRTRPVEEGPAGTVDDALDVRPRRHWLEPIPDRAVVPAGADPQEQAALRQRIRLAFVAALQRLPPRQRATLLLRDVVGMSAAEVAASLDTSVAAVQSAQQRAREALASRDVDRPGAPLTAAQAALLERYLAAFEAYDVDALVSLLREDATLSMPPYTLWLQGRATIRAWLLGRGLGCRGSRLLPTAACGAPAFGQYRPAPGGGHLPWALITLELDGDQVVSMTSFLDTEALFPRFDLPSALPA
ncbi:MAG: RNA polymerase subunit sigma-70 [Myxococcales bacterium]|nr:RNA polymerase subunit sigma-70 [Myxococcales bacterium]